MDDLDHKILQLLGENALLGKSYGTSCDLL